MSARIRSIATADTRFELLTQLGIRDRETSIRVDLDRLKPVHIVIDFSNEEGSRHALAMARAAACSLLVGTPGPSSGILDDIGDFSRSAAVLIATNTSLGAPIMNHAVARIARVLTERWAIDVLERHHVQKRDAPSVTSRQLMAPILREAGTEVPTDHVHCIRAKDIVWDHQIEFTGLGENLKILHEMTNRKVFARNALDAAAWFCTQSPGGYGIEYYLGLS